MTKIVISVCDVCGAEQRSDRPVYWALLYAVCSWKVPIDGINGGKADLLLCRECRSQILDSIEQCISTLQQSPRPRKERCHDDG